MKSAATLAVIFLAKFVLFLIVLHRFSPETAASFAVWVSAAQLVSLVLVGVPARSKNEYLQGRLDRAKLNGLFATSSMLLGLSLLSVWAVFYVLWAIGLPMPVGASLGVSYGIVLVQANSYSLYAEAIGYPMRAYNLIAVMLLILNLSFYTFGEHGSLQLLATVAVIASILFYVGLNKEHVGLTAYFKDFNRNQFFRVEISTVPVSALELAFLSNAVSAGSVVAYALCQRIFGALPAFSALLTRTVWSYGAKALAKGNSAGLKSAELQNNVVFLFGVIGTVLAVPTTFLLPGFIDVNDADLSAAVVLGFAIWSLTQLLNRKQKNRALAHDQYSEFARGLAYLNWINLCALSVSSLLAAPVVIWVLLKIIFSTACLYLMGSSRKLQG